ncbi:Re/Si-specific NAD(P)(+) transhydrogenase subunit alpha [Paraferrimonas sp. SM1919]|uniref:Re/Si-specific NAD(P)(+) transhydrogenase subunit alpha n=1 Tax=Paraferrimonas sp. SM1919 TaxID=2662263 RepID=UPI0013D42F8B|nr:Re/Si-specific NAD(P)(+) transhydrogenase subunit alpha [Paraferrimonas sp. SM1919]
MKIGLLKERNQAEKRVALIPAAVTKLSEQGFELMVQAGAGIAAGYTDEDYIKANAKIVTDDEVFCADIITAVNVKGAMAEYVLAMVKPQQIIIATLDPLTQHNTIRTLAAKHVTAFGLELVPRITRAQSMDVLSSMATIAGYKAVIMAADKSPRLFPMMMTAAGTLKPTRAFVMGVGVAGLQACATAKRLGAVVEAYDIRPAAQEQILSVGARPVVLDIEADHSQAAGGYAQEQSDDFIQRQQQAMADVLAQQDVVITTAAIPGRPAPKLITKAMVEQMKPGTIIIDLAAETGGNCELTKLDEEVVINGVTIVGPSNIACRAATHASQMYSTNIENLLKLMTRAEGQVILDFEDEVIKETCATHQGKIISSRLLDLIKLDQPQATTAGV